MARGDMEHVPKSDLEKIPGFADLTELQRQQFIKQDQAIGQEIEQISKLRSSVGNRLLTIRNICKKNRVFTAWLKYRGIPYTNASNWINAAIHAKMYLPVNFANIAFEIGLDKINLAYVTAHPPKNSADPKYVGGYLKEMRESTKRGSEIDYSKEQLLNQAYLGAVLKLEKLKDLTPKQKRDEAIHLSGMILAHAGIQSAIQVQPVKPPERRGKGRPPKTIEGKLD